MGGPGGGGGGGEGGGGREEEEEEEGEGGGGGEEEEGGKKKNSTYAQTAACSQLSECPVQTTWVPTTHAKLEKLYSCNDHLRYSYKYVTYST